MSSILPGACFIGHFTRSVGIASGCGSVAPYRYVVVIANTCCSIRHRRLASQSPSSASSVRSRIPTCRISALYFFHAGSPRGSGFPGLCTSYCPSSPSLCNAASRPAVPGSPEFRSASTEHIHLPRVQASIHQQSLASRAYSVEQSAICLSLNIIPAAPLWRFYEFGAVYKCYDSLNYLLTYYTF